MISAADIPLGPFLAKFAQLAIPVAFLVPTQTGYDKSIMDATAPVRELLADSGVHDYVTQLQGPANKVVLEAYFVNADSVTQTTVSLYRPITKKGDPRIWFSDLKHYCHPYNVLALVVVNGIIHVINLSDTKIADSLLNNGYVYDLLFDHTIESSSIEFELLEKIKSIHDSGFIPSVTPGDPGVGDTLEHALGISRNNKKTPDYKGIELKATRLTKNGKKRKETRPTIFSQVPDGGLSYREIIEQYGKMQIPRNHTEARLQIYETCSALRVNSYGLTLEVDDVSDKLYLVYVDDNGKRKRISWWEMASLRARLLEKHPKTFWVSAESQLIGETESFLYTKVLYTRNPNAMLLTPLLASGIITVDLLAYITKEGRYRDHGVLFKINKQDLEMLFANPEEFTL